MESKIRKLIDANPNNWFEGNDSISSLVSSLKEDYEVECKSLFFILLNPDSSNYEDRLNHMEIELEGQSIMPFNPDLTLGINPQGEVGRVVAFGNEMSKSELMSALGDVAYEVVELAV
jgi:hypothetical protein